MTAARVKCPGKLPEEKRSKSVPQINWDFVFKPIRRSGLIYEKGHSLHNPDLDL